MSSEAPLIYREEVLTITGVIGDINVTWHRSCGLRRTTMAKRKRTTIDRDAQRELEELIERGWAELRVQQAAKPARHDTRPT